MKKRIRLKWLKRAAERRKSRMRDCRGCAMLHGRWPGRLAADGDAGGVGVPGSAEIYRSELEYVLRCILERPHIETGGELFGFWKDDGTPVVAYALGPGPDANHELAFFNQDLRYLTNVGAALTGKYGLEHIGEWHSHHGLGLAHPSGHDAATVAHGVRSHGRNRFLLCIGTCTERSASLGGFAFTKDGGEDYSHVDWRIIGADSPFRGAVDGDCALSDILVHPLTMEEIRHGSKKA